MSGRTSLPCFLVLLLWFYLTPAHHAHALESGEGQPVIEQANEPIKIKDKKYIVSIKGKPFLTVLDRLCYLDRINYTFSTDIPSKILSADKEFANRTELIDFLVEQVNGNKPRDCYPLLCRKAIARRDDVQERDFRGKYDSFFTRIRTGRDPLSMEISGKKAWVLKLWDEYNDAGKGRKLFDEIKSPSSDERRLLLKWNKGMVEAVDGSTAPHDRFLRVVQSNFIDAVADELLEEFNGFITAELNDADIKLYESYIPKRALELLKEAPEQNRTGVAMQVRRHIIERIFGTEIVSTVRLKWRYIGDGIEFLSDTDILQPELQMATKKVFLFNTDTETAKGKLVVLLTGKGESETDESANLTLPNSIISIPTQNALLIKADARTMDTLSQMIFALDSAYDSVLVETKVFIYDDGVLRKIGTALDITKSAGTDRALTLKTLFGENITEATMPVFGFSDVDNKLNLLTSLALFGREGMVRIAAEPSLVLKPGERAEVNMSTVKYVMTEPGPISAAGLEEITTAISFRLTPTILSNEKILLDVDLLQSEFVPTTEEQITVSKTENKIKTKIITGNKEWVSLGGIKTKRTAKANSGIPFLKDLPVLGILFGSRSEETVNLNIEFAIRPTIKYTSAENAERFRQEFESMDNKVKDMLGVKPSGWEN